MRINRLYKLREIAGEAFVINQGIANVNMTKIITLNKSARLLYKTLAGKDFTCTDAADILVENYGVDTETATKDAQKWIDGLRQCGILEDE